MPNAEIKFRKESIEELQNKFDFLHTHMDALIRGLGDSTSYDTSVTTLFREFHSLKALVSYLKAEAMERTVHTFEEILSVLRYKQPPVAGELLDWLFLASDHILGWYEFIEKGNLAVEPLDAYLLNIIKTTTVTDVSGAELLKTDTVLVLSENKEFVDLCTENLRERTAAVHAAAALPIIQATLRANPIDIILCDSVFKGFEVMKLFLWIKREYPEIPVIVRRLSVLSDKKLDLMHKLDLTDYLQRDIDAEDLVLKMEVTAKSHNKAKGIKLLASPLLKKAVESLKPLPETIKKLQSFQGDPEVGIRDIIAVVSTDMALSSKLLKLVNSPGFGLHGNINSVQQAVSLLGKEKTIALSLQTFAQDSFEFDLSPYNMSSDTFFSVASKRMNLAVAWYSKVSLYETSLLSTAALIANIGQLLIVQEIKARGEATRFLKLTCDLSPAIAEIETLHTSAEDMTADILKQWGLDDKLVNLIRFANDLIHAPDEIKQLCIALYVILSTVPTQGTAAPAKKILDEMSDLLEEMNFDSALYRQAVAKVFA